MLTDQERFDVSAPGGPAVETPNIDRLRRAGMTFDRAYTPIGICTAARASLLSGRYPHNHGMLNNCHEPDAILPNLPGDIPTFGDLLGEAGYANTYAGKWHVGRDQRPEDFGFRYLGGGDGYHDDSDPSFREFQRRRGVDPDMVELQDTLYTRVPDPVLIAATTNVPPEATRTAYVVDQTIDALREHAHRPGPFFHRVDFVGPHHPYAVPEPYASMYDPAEIEPWGNFEETFDGKPRVHEQYRFYRGVDELTWEEWSAIVAKYFGFVTFIDDQVGRILDALDELSLENTAVVRTSDHGDFTGSHGQFNKGPMMYEETYHIPLFVRWPGVTQPGSSCDRFVRLLDLMPTFLEMADVSIPADIDGRSLVPLLRGESVQWPETLFAEYHGDEFGLYSQRMVRSDGYKYVYNAPDVDEFYDLRDDPHELHNRIDDPAYAEERSTLRRTMVEWMDKTDDTIRNWSRNALGMVTDHD